MDLKKPEVSVLLVNYHQKKELKNLLQNLPAFLKNIPYEVLVFDNSQDLSKSTLYKIYKRKHNIGYGSAVNFLSLKAKGQYLLILNPDVTLEGNLKKDLDAFKKKFDFSKGILSLGLPDTLYTLPLVSKIYKQKRFSSYGFLISTDLFRTIGGFDIHYFLYFEDDDLALSLRKFNIHSSYVTKPLVKHLRTYKNMQHNRRKEHYYNSLIYFLKKNKKPWGYFFIPFVYLKKIFL